MIRVLLSRLSSPPPHPLYAAFISVRRIAFLLFLKAQAKVRSDRWRALSNSLSSTPQAAEEKGDEGERGKVPKLKIV